MKHIIKNLAIAMILELLSVSGSSGQPIENEAFHINIDNCKTSIDLKLSDLIDSCWLVALETTSESVLSNNINHVFISNKYLLIDDGSGIYKFSADGKFIKKVINTGRGPDELSQTFNLYFSESKNLLLIDDYSKNKTHFLCYDIISEVFMPPVRKCFSDRWGDFVIFKDSLIIGSLSPFNAAPNPYAIFIQDFKGNFISGIQSKRGYINLQNKHEAFQKMLFYPGDKFIHVKYFLDDTLFNLKDNLFIPYLISNYKSNQTEPPHILPVIGDKKNSYNEFENSRFLIFRNRTYLGTKELGIGAKAVYKSVYFLLDKSNGKYGEIKSYNDDFMSQTQTYESESMTFPTSLQNDRLYVFYYPYELLKKTPDYFANNKFSDGVYKQINKIKSQIIETDNPILLIGKPNKKILTFK